MSAETDAGTTVTHLADEKRFELRVDGDVAGWVDYLPGGKSVIIAHTEISDAYAGRGLAGMLVKEVLMQLRAEGTTVIPVCPFATSYIRRHPEHVVDVDPSLRSQFPAGDG